MSSSSALSSDRANARFCDGDKGLSVSGAETLLVGWGCGEWLLVCLRELAVRGQPLRHRVLKKDKGILNVHMRCMQRPERGCG